MTNHRLTYCGMEGEGRTVALAKQDAARKINAVLDGSYAPVCIPGRVTIGIVFRTTFGWSYRIVERAGVELSTCYHPSEGFDSADRACRSHMAQNELDLDHPFDVPTYLTDKRDRSEYIDYAAWQLAARAAQTQGLTDTEIHAWACQHQREYMPQAA